MVLSALAGCAIYNGVATAYGWAAAFRQTLASVAERTLTANILLEAVRFQFGATEISSVARGSNPEHCVSTPLHMVMSRSLKAEAALRAELLSFANPFNQDEEGYIREWGSSIHTLPSIPQTCLLRCASSSLTCSSNLYVAA